VVDKEVLQARQRLDIFGSIVMEKKAKLEALLKKQGESESKTPKPSSIAYSARKSRGH
jgi:hypothetical protein